MRRTASRGSRAPGGRPLAFLSGKPHLHGSRVRFEPLSASKRGNRRRKFLERFGRKFLNRDHFDKIGSGQTTAKPRRTRSRQHMVGAGSIIARGFGTSRTNENTSRVADQADDSRVMHAHMFRRKTVRCLDGLIERFTQNNGAVLADRLARNRGCWKILQLTAHFCSDSFAEASRCGEQNRGCVSIVFSLREHVGGNPGWISILRDDDDFRRTRDEVDSDVTRQQLFRRRDVDVAGTHDAVHARNRRGPESKRRNGLRSAHAEDVPHIQKSRHGKNFGAGMRRGNADGFDTSHLSGDDGHQQRRWQRIAARRNVRAHRIERANDLSEAASIGKRYRRFGRQLAARILANIDGGGFKRGAKLGDRAALGAGKLRVRYKDGRGLERIELPGIFKQRLIAALFHVFKNRRDHFFGFGKPHRFSRDELPGLRKIDNPQHGYITILFSGYSTIPWPPASLRRGIMLRTEDSSRIVLTASQSS